MAHVPAVERRAQLVRAAIDLLTRSGPAAGSTRAIAKELGVPQATLHYVFGSKEELYRAVMMTLTEELVGYVRGLETPAGPSFEASVATLAERLWQSVIEEPSKHQLLTELGMVALRSPQLREMVEEHRRTVDQATESVISETADHFGFDLAVDTLFLARYFLAAMDGLVMQHLTEPAEDSERWVLDTIVDSTLRLALTGSDRLGSARGGGAG